MADKAHILTDEKLEQMERHLSAIYSRAEKEIQKTADEYFNKFQFKTSHIAGTFCAKEAFVKALKTGFTKDISLLDVEVLHYENGVPYINLNNEKNYGIPVPDYVDQNVSTKVVKIIQSYTGIVDKMVWRKF